MADVSENVGQTVTATVVPFEADGTTQTPGAIVSAQVWSIADPTIASQNVNPDGSATYTGLTAGSTTVSVTATVTDSDGTVQNFTAQAGLTVIAVVAPDRTASIQIQFGTPTA
jgi:hypothetical protein